MSSLTKKMLIGGIAALLTQVAGAIADPITITMTGSNNKAPVMTVGQEITSFANRYGDPVILHGAVNLNAPVAMASDAGLSSDQAIAALSQAAGAHVVRVYFVTPATASKVTNVSAAAKLVDNTGRVSLDLRHVSAEGAIQSVAAADDAQVRFPDGVPIGTVNMGAATLPLNRAVAWVASLTKTHWSLGYLLESNGIALPPISTHIVNVNIAANNNTTSGDSTVGGMAAPSVAPLVSNDTAANSTTTSGDSTVGGVTPAAAASNGPVVIASLPPLKPLPRDSHGNILPFTVHFPVLQTTTTAATTAGVNMTPAQQAAARQAAAFAAQQQAYYNTGMSAGNVPQSVYNPTVQTFPGDNLFGGPTGANQDYLGSDYGTVTTEIPGGNESGFRLLPYTGY